MNETMQGIHGMSALFTQADNIFQQGHNAVMTVVFAAMVIMGLIECFFGYKVMRWMFAIAGFFLGAAIGIVAAYFLPFSSEAATVALIGVCGLLGAFLLFRMYLVGVFLTNFTLSFLVFALLLRADSVSLLTVALIGALLIGVIAVKFVRVLTILSTGVSGGMMAGRALLALVGMGGFPALLAGLVLTVLGIWYQWKTTGTGKPHIQAEAPEAAPAPVPAASNGGPAAPAPEAQTADADVPAAPAPQTGSEPEQSKPAPASSGSKLPRGKVLLLGGGVLTAALVLALVLMPRGEKSPAADAAGPVAAIKGYTDSDGKDLSKTIVWLDPEYADDELWELIGLYAGEKTTGILLESRTETLYSSYTLLDRDGQVVKSGLPSARYGGMVDGEPWFLCTEGRYEGYDFIKDYQGYIDAKGNHTLDLGDRLWNDRPESLFSDGYCYWDETYLIDGHGWCILDTQGNYLAEDLPYRPSSVPECNGGLFLVCDPDTDLYGMIDPYGVQVIPCQYDSLSVPDKNGTAIACLDGSWGAIDWENNTMVSFAYDSFYEVAAVLGWPQANFPAIHEDYLDTDYLGGVYRCFNWNDTLGDSYCGLVSLEGEPLTEFVYRWIVPCSQEPGLFLAQREDGQWVYLDYTGAQRSPEFTAPGSFDNYSGLIILEGQYGVMPRMLTAQEAETFAKLCA